MCRDDLIKLATRAINVSMQAEVIDLKALSKQELEEKYLLSFGYSAPIGYTKSYLIKEIIWQEKYNKRPE